MYQVRKLQIGVLYEGIIDLIKQSLAEINKLGHIIRDYTVQVLKYAVDFYDNAGSTLTHNRNYHYKTNSRMLKCTKNCKKMEDTPRPRGSDLGVT